MSSKATVLGNVRDFQAYAKKLKESFSLKKLVYEIVLKEVSEWGGKEVNKHLANKIAGRLPEGLRLYYHTENNSWGNVREVRIWGECVHGQIDYHDKLEISIKDNMVNSVMEPAAVRIKNQVEYYATAINRIIDVEVRIPKVVAAYTAAKTALSECTLLLEGTPFTYLVPDLP